MDGENAPCGWLVKASTRGWPPRQGGGKDGGAVEEGCSAAGRDACTEAPPGGDLDWLGVDWWAVCGREVPYIVTVRSIRTVGWGAGLIKPVVEECLLLPGSCFHSSLMEGDG